MPTEGRAQTQNVEVWQRGCCVPCYICLLENAATCVGIKREWFPRYMPRSGHHVRVGSGVERRLGHTNNPLTERKHLPKNFEPGDELFKHDSHCKPFATNPGGGKHPGVLKLAHDKRVFEAHGLAAFVWFDAANKVGGTAAHCCIEQLERHSKLCADSDWPFVGCDCLFFRRSYTASSCGGSLFPRGHRFDRTRRGVDLQHKELWNQRRCRVYEPFGHVVRKVVSVLFYKVVGLVPGR
jgi:hypothetical protein